MIYKRTYAGSDYEEIWNSLVETGRLTRILGIEIANQLGYEYPIRDDERVVNYLKRIERKVASD